VHNFWCIAAQTGIGRFTISQARTFRGKRNPSVMKNGASNLQTGKIGWILLWLIGVPIPILLILFLIRGCT